MRNLPSQYAFLSFKLALAVLNGAAVVTEMFLENASNVPAGRNVAGRTSTQSA